MNAARKYDIIGNHNEYDIPISRNSYEDIKMDPFGLGNNVKGLASLNHQTLLSNYAVELVATYAKYEYDEYGLCLSDIPEPSQGELVRLYIESINRDIDSACYGDDESINSSFLCALLSMLQDNSQRNRENFAEVTRNNVFLRYEKTLQKILDEACLNYLYDIKHEQGLYACVDWEHGDTIWK